MERVNPANKTDRRNYFRIDDVTILYYRVLSEDEDINQDCLAQLSIDKLTLKARFESLSRELTPLGSVIGEANPKLAQYLAVIDKKLDMLSEVLLNSALDELNEEPKKVNISAGGLSFESSDPVELGSLLELRIILLPTYVGIYSHARVVSCKAEGDEADDEGMYKIAVEFIRMDEELRDLISRHVLSRERAALMSGSRRD